MTGLSGHSHFADVGKVDEAGLFRAETDHLGRTHDELALLAGHHVGVFLAHDVEHAREQLVVGVVAVGSGPAGAILVRCRSPQSTTNVSTAAPPGAPATESVPAMAYSEPLIHRQITLRTIIGQSEHRTGTENRASFSSYCLKFRTELDCNGKVS